jgi:hypothetical protein
MFSGAFSDKRLSRFCVMAPCVALLACAAPDEAVRSPAYDAGFGDGCATATADMAAVPRPAIRDEAAFSGDTGYRAGWLSGHAACRMQSGPPRL